MNALCYKTVFSTHLGALVAVGEHASSQSKGQGAGASSGAVAWTLGSVLRYVGVLTWGFASVSLAWSQTLPQGGRVSQGQVTISQSASQMAITQSTAKAVVNWDSFDIGANAKVNIAQPGSQSVLLNRVLSDNPTQILGQLQANGQVVLVNPKGIVVGSDGSVSASAFTASTLNISDADFMAGNGRYTREGSTGEVVNKGRINVAPGGYVALLGARVSNEGQIIAPQGSVALGAAETVTVPIGRTGKIKLELTPASINASVANQTGGLIVAEGGQVYMQAAALGQAVASALNSGHIDTSGVQAGAVHVLADGGQIKVDGSITANSSHPANKGGDIVIGRDLETGALAASTDMKGATLESQRGFVETSGHELVVDGARVKAGSWLLDPDNIDITGDATAAVTGYSKVKASDIVAALNQGTSVTVSTTSGITPVSVDYTANNPGDGNIQVSAPIATNVVSGATATLSLVADNGITIASTGGISDTAGNGVLNVDLNAKGRAMNLDTASAGLVVSGTIHIEGKLKMTGHNSRSGGDVTNLRSAIVVNNIANTTTIKANAIEMVGASDGFWALANHNNGFGYGSGFGVILNGAIEAQNNIDIAGWTRNNGDGVKLGNLVKSLNGNVDVLGLIQSAPAGVHVTGKISALNGAVTLAGGASVKPPGTYFTSINKADFLTGTTVTGGAAQGININNGTIEGGNVTLQSPSTAQATPQTGVLVQGTSKLTASSTLKIDVQSTSTTLAATRLSGTSTLSATSIDIQSDTLELSATATTPVSASSSVNIAPRTAGLAVQLGAADTLTSPRILGLSQSELDKIATSSLTIGHASTGNITVVSAVSTKDATGDLALVSSSNLAINAALQAGTTGTKNLTLELTGSGSATQNASLKANNLTLLGSNATYTLSNTANEVSTLAANVKTLGYSNATALNIGSVNSTNGITASGTVAVATQSGNLSVTQAVNTTDASNAAIVLNAGVLGQAGTASGGDIQLGGAYDFSTGDEGRTTLFTGNTGNASLTSLVGSGSNRFRYNSDELTSSFSAALGSGTYAIYREAPVVSVAFNNASKTYDAQSFTGGTGLTQVSGFVNGDTDAQLGSIKYSGTSQGAINAGTYVISGTALSGLGYALSYADGELTVNKANLTLSGTRVYDAGTTFAGQHLIATGVAGQTFSVTGSGDASNLANKNVQANQPLNSLTGLALGASANNGLVDNYNAISTTGSSVSVTPKALTVIATAADKAYDATLLATVNSINSADIIGNDTVNIAYSSANFANKNVARDASGGIIGQSVTVSGLSLSGADAGNYSIASETVTSAKITPKALTVAVSVADKVYDGGTSATVSAKTSNDIFSGDAVSIGFAAANFADKNVARDANGNVMEKTATVSGLSLTGADAGNYSLTSTTATDLATISAKALTVSVSVGDKVYDAGTAATVSAKTSSDILGGDTVSILHTAANFADKNVARDPSGQVVNQTATVSGLSLSGTHAGNYVLQNTSAAGSAKITPKALTASLIGNVSKEYDGTVAAQVAPNNFSLTGWAHVDEGATVSPTTATYASASVAGNQGQGLVSTTLQASDLTPLQNTLLSNYTLPNSATGQVGTITRAPLTIQLGNTSMFVTQDPNTAVDHGFVVVGQLKNGETADAVLGTLTRSYQGAANPASGSYSAVYGLNTTPNPDNYVVTIQKGDLTVVPADHLLIHVGGKEVTYGTLTAALAGTAATQVQAQYCLVANDCNGANIANLSMSQQNSRWTATDVSNSSVSFNTVVNTTGKVSGGGYLNVGSYSFEHSDLRTTGTVNFNGVAINSGLLKVSPKALSLSANAVQKEYDGTASLSGVVLTPSGAFEGDAIGVSYGAGSFDGKNAGAQGFTLSGLALQGADQANYVLDSAQLSGTGSITPKAITVSGLQAQDKVYDGSTQASVQTSGAVFNGIVAGDQLSVTATGQFDTRHVGTNKAVTLSSSFGGADLDNYSITPQASSTASITPAPLVVTASAARKTYDGNTTAPGVGTVGALAGATAGDTVAFAGSLAFTDKNAGTGKTVTVTGVRLVDGSNTDVSGNYAITYVDSQNGTIDRANANLAAQASSTVYNGAVQSQSGIAYSGFVAGDDVQATGLASGRNAGSYLSSLSATGTDAGNYNITYSNAALSITRRPASLSALGQTVVYNGLVQSLNGTQGTGFVAGDALSFGGLPSGRNVGQYSSAMTVSGADAANYDITLGSATLIITPKSASVTARPEHVTYNGQTQQSSAAVLEGFVAGDDIRVSGLASGRNAGVYGSNVLASGQDAGNYSITYQQGALTIDKAPLQFVGTLAANKVYDGNSQASVTAGSIMGLVGSETLSIDTVQGQFDSAEPGSNKPVTVVYGLGDGQNGGLVANYDWSPVTVTASIRREAVPNQATPEASRSVARYSRLSYIGFGGLTNMGAATGQLYYPIRNTDAQQCTPRKLEECICEQAQEGALEICYPQSRGQVSASGPDLNTQH
ncbi:YDG domain-containing protein [Limnohabitans sp.]|uniref:YDG domain-containing protein n=2 Tax=Limnohabitans sp. TaxID=1907725 RepID=UPI0031FD30E0